MTDVVQDSGGLDLTTSYVYDDLGNMTQMTDPRGKISTYEYGDVSCTSCGGGGQLIKVTDALSHEMEWVYDADGLLETSIDAAGVETDYAYDDMGRVTTVTYPAGGTVTATTTYTLLGQVASRTGFGGNTTSYVYDHMGRTVTVTDAVGDVDYAYNSLGLLVSVTDSLGHATANTYDTTFQLSKVTDAIGKETHYAYDAYGRKSSVGAGTSGTVDPTTYTYSGTTGQLTAVEYGSSTYTANYTYDGEGRLVQLTDWIDGVDGLRYEYDDVGRLVEITDYDDSTLTYTYDDAGNVLTMTDYHGNTTTYTYNDIGQLATLTAPGSKVWSYTYDTGNRLSRVDIPNGMHTEYAYDASGRQDAILHKDGTTVVQGFEYTFEDGGNITRIDHEDGSYWEYDYDGRERLVEAVRGNHATPTIEATYAYTYDDGDNMLTRVTPWFDDFQDGNITGWLGSTAYYTVSGGVLKNTLDTTVRDLYLSETDADQDLRFDYVRYSTTGRADVYLRVVDGNNQLYLELNPGDIKLRQKDGGTLSTLATYTTTVAEDAWYQLRAVLDGTSVKIYWGAQGGSFDEIISATTTETSTVRAAWIRAQANSEHGFDNIQLFADGRSTTQTFTYNNANEQLTSTVNGVTTDMTYDEWGRLADRDDNTHTATYAYRYDGKLYGFTSDFPGEGNVTYETGGDGKRRSRVAGSDETWYNWEGWGVISEEDAADGTSGSLKRTYIGRNTAYVEGSSPSTEEWRYYTIDFLKSSRAVWREDRTACASLDYTALGEIFVAVGSAAAIGHTYTGKDTDAATGLYFTPFRYYNPEFARWTMRDPVGIGDGPNMYAHVHANPINYSDPLGLFTITNSEKCCGKEKDIESAANTGCANLTKWIADPDLRTCVGRRCKSGKIKCRQKCPKGDVGYSNPFSHTAGMCVGVNDNDMEDTVIHEWLHTCGYHRQDHGDNPPWGDGK